MTEDLAARVLAAIEKTEQLARDTAPFNPCWSVHLVPPLQQVRAGVMAILSGADSVLPHIAQQDPAGTLRRCEADRKILDLHNDPVPGFSRQQCTTCVGNWATEEGEDWPCATLRALAEAYSVTTEETTHG